MPNQILFETDNIPSINFASCQCLVPSLEPIDNLVYKFKNAIAYNNIPPIRYISNSKGYHLKMELFDNRFVRIYQTKIRDYMARKGEYIYSHDPAEGHRCYEEHDKDDSPYDELIDYEKMVSTDDNKDIIRNIFENKKEEISSEEDQDNEETKE